MEEFCEEGKDKRFTNEVNLGHANPIVEALARYGEECEAKVHALLGQKVKDYSHSPMKWMEPLVVQLAGQAHLDSTLPLVINKLMGDGDDVLNAECATALARFGTPAVLHAVAEAFPRADRHFRLYATNPLENIDTPRRSPPHFELTRYSDCVLRLVLRVHGQRFSIHASMTLGPACHRQANSSGFRVNHRKSKSRRPQFVVVISEECQNIHSDLAVATCLNLLGHEEDEMIQRGLAHAVLSQFAPEGIEAARKLLMGRELDIEGRGLRDHLLETCALVGERFPEYDEWLAAAKTEKEEHRKRVKELEDDPNGMLLFALEKLTGKKAADVPRANPLLPPTPPPTLTRQSDRRQKVGRNDPCPCGSGKKFKKCCGRNSP